MDFSNEISNNSQPREKDILRSPAVGCKDDKKLAKDWRDTFGVENEFKSWPKGTA